MSGVPVRRGMGVAVVTVDGEGAACCTSRVPTLVWTSVTAADSVVTKECS